MIKTLFSAVVLMTAACSIPTQAQLLNTGFEISDGGSGAQNWGNWYNPAAGVSQQRVTSEFHSGGASANTHLTLDPDNDLGAWVQPLTGWNVGDTVDVSIWVKTAITGGAFAQLALEAIGGGGINWGPSSAAGTWTQLSHSFVIPAGTTQLNFLAAHANTTDSSGDIWFDDAAASITPIPEPSTVGLLGLGLVGILGAVYRKK
jgi:hypothetical protein